MTITIKTLDAASMGAWNDYVASQPDATFFHRAEWRDVVEHSFGQATHFLYAEERDTIRGVLPLAHYKSRMFGNALISNGCCMGGGPVADDDAVYAALDHHAIRLMNTLGCRYLEYRRPVRRHADWQAKDDLYVNFERPLAVDAEENLRQIPRKQRAVLRKAKDNPELSWTIDDDVGELWSLYAVSVRNLGTPVFAKRYFAALKRAFGSDCDILTVRHRGRAVSSVISFWYRDRVMPYYTGSLPQARALGANDLMYWHLMRHAVARGYRVFDFGRSKLGTGPYSFKKNWGFEPVPSVHEFYLADGQSIPEINPMNPKYKLFVSLWKKLPLALANSVGPLIVRNIG